LLAKGTFSSSPSSSLATSWQRDNYIGISVCQRNDSESSPSASTTPAVHLVSRARQDGPSGGATNNTHSHSQTKKGGVDPAMFPPSPVKYQPHSFPPATLLPTYRSTRRVNGLPMRRYRSTLSSVNPFSAVAGREEERRCCVIPKCSWSEVEASVHDCRNLPFLLIPGSSGAIVDHW